ncbi:TPA: hypothetical protein N5L33_001156 [Enterobacter cloacae subsp. cloacae]|nr:hypothetical protein [Enterobacter cloacae subsp. cloacae]HCM9539191.1 hypothetical protein [Enterobacter cloacae subsp. cloacae]
MNLYKYMKSEHAEKFLKNGTLRIGTLYNFQEYEKFNAAIADKHEGCHFPIMEIEGTIFGRELSVAQKEFLGDGFTVAPDISITGLRVEKRIYTNNSYIFCLTTEPSKKAMEEFECDVCLEITNPNALFRAITRKMRDKTDRLEWHGSITYMNKSYPFHKEVHEHPATTKDEKYLYQKEYRAIWLPKKSISSDAQISPLFVRVPKIIKYCRIHTF